MDTIDVTAGDTIKKGEKIGTVGNSGIVISGGLGGYHVHFQIDREVNGRWTTAYKGCADASK